MRMNTLHKFLTIAFLSVSIFIAGVNVDFANAQNTAGEKKVVLELSDEERAWLAEHPEIVLGTTASFPPNVIKYPDGTYRGVLPDFYEQISQLLGAKVNLHVGESWSRVQKQAKNRELDGLAIGGRDPHRDKYYTATDLLFPSYSSVFAANKHDLKIHSFKDLDGMRIGYKRGARPAGTYLATLPSAIIKPYDDHESMTQALLTNEVDVIVAWVSYDHWRKKTLQGTIDRIYLIKEYPIEMVVYIRNDWPELIPIVNKAIAVLQKNELPRILDKWFGEWPQESTATGILLTPEELSWLDKKLTVRVGVTDYPPYIIIKSNEAPQGIVIEYLKLIGKRSGVTFKFEVTNPPFAEFLESMERFQGPDMTPAIMPTPEREQFLSFSETYISSPYVIFIREYDKPILDINGLAGKTVAIPRGFVVHDKLARDYPEISLSLFDSDEKALQAVAVGQADAYIGNLTVASHIIHRNGFSSLQVTAAGPLKEQSLSMGNRKDWPELTSIINKALASITEEEKTDILSKYFAVRYEQGIDKAKVLKWVLVFGGAALGIVLIFLFWNRRLSREIGKRMQTEKNLKQARDDAETANQAKSIFLANMSHELRTPLNAILGFSEMLAREPDATADQQGKLTIINRSGEHLLGMINDVLDLSKIEAGWVELSEEVFDLHRLLEDLGKMFELRTKEKGLRFSLDRDAELARYFRGDSGKLRQILNNLLGNAVKNTEKGSVSLRARSLPRPNDPAMAKLQLEVEDSGRGISPKELERIFESFYQVGRSQGSGLGLSISKSFVEMMDGKINVNSTPGKGSLFRVEVPLALAKTAEVVNIHTAGPAVRGLKPGQPAYRILVVEDNLENRLLLSNLLISVGFEIREAENGEEAIELFHQWQPHFIWMDIRMPVMDGYEATAKLRSLPGGDTVKIVAITASVFNEQRQDILSAGCDDVVSKPYKDYEIFATMARLLDIKYLYEEESEELTLEKEINLTKEMLADLPEELLQELRETTLALNREAALEVISRIAVEAPDVATGLKELVNNYQMDQLRDLLGKVKNK